MSVAEFLLLVFFGAACFFTGWQAKGLRADKELFAAYAECDRKVDRLLGRVCGAKANLYNDKPFVCARPPGHDGWHRSKTGTEWAEIPEVTR